MFTLPPASLILMYGDSHDRGNTAGGFEVLARCFHYFCVWRQP